MIASVALASGDARWRNGIGQFNGGGFPIQRKTASSKARIFRCASCDGYGWFDDDFGGESGDCDWCAGVGYVYRRDGRDTAIPKADFEAVADELERLEHERLRELGYQGAAKKPWQQTIRKDTQLGRNPYSDGDRGR